MKVFFRSNLGSMDAKTFGIDDHKECTAGSSAEVSKDVGDALIKAGVATDNQDDPIVRSAQGKSDKDEPAAKVKAVAKAPEIAAPFKPATPEK